MKKIIHRISCTLLLLTTITQGLFSQVNIIEAKDSYNDLAVEITGNQIKWSYNCSGRLDITFDLNENYTSDYLDTYSSTNGISFYSYNQIGDSASYNIYNSSEEIVATVFAYYEAPIILNIDFDNYYNQELISGDTLFMCSDFDRSYYYNTSYSIETNLGSIDIDTNLNARVDFYVNGMFFSSQDAKNVSFYDLDLEDGDLVYATFNDVSINYYGTCGEISGAGPYQSRTLKVKMTTNEINNITEIINGNTVICPGDKVTLGNISQATTNYAWYKGSHSSYSFSYSDTVTVNSPGKYVFVDNSDFAKCPAISEPITIVKKENCEDGYINGYVRETGSRTSANSWVYNTLSGITVKTNTGLVTVSDSTGFYEFYFDETNIPNSVLIADIDYVEDSRSLYFSSFLIAENRYLYTYFLEDNDLATHLSSGRNRPGFTIPYYVTVENRGKNELTTNVSLVLDNNLTYSVLDEGDTPNTINRNTLTWNNVTLASGESDRFIIYATLDRTTNLGSTLESFVISSKQDDKAFNNIDTLLSEVTGSYDPNDKLASPQGVFTEGYVSDTTDFEYTIRFQNTGTDTAFTVRVEDVIDTKVLDLTSINMIDASHDYKMTISNDTVTWTFNNILLLDSTSNEPLSHGFIHFSIDQKEDNPQGTMIANQASIFFDFNDPIITNETMNIVDNFLVTTIEEKQAKSIGKLNTYPNPVTNILNIQLSEEASFSLYNQLGEHVFQSETIENIDLSHIETGVYFYQVQTADRNYSGKILKKGN